MRLNPWVRKIPWNPPRYSCLENLGDRGAWPALVHRVAKSWTQRKWLSAPALSRVPPWGELAKMARSGCLAPCLRLTTVSELSSFIALCMRDTRCLLGHKILPAVRIRELHPERGSIHCCVPAGSVGPARRECCYGGCPSQDRINVSAGTAAPGQIGRAHV